MTDNEIIELYWQRDESAIEKTESKYGQYCYSVAYNILHNSEDALECVNDTYMGAWNSIPPHRPEVLSAFLGRITRNIAIKKLRGRNAKKRGGGEKTLVFDELEELVPSGKAIDDELEAKELAKIIDGFLRTLTDEERRIFICRYWYFDSVEEISKRFGFSQSKVKMKLMRTRKKLLDRLEKEELFYEI